MPYPEIVSLGELKTWNAIIDQDVKRPACVGWLHHWLKLYILGYGHCEYAETTTDFIYLHFRDTLYLLVLTDTTSLVLFFCIDIVALLAPRSSIN